MFSCYLIFDAVFAHTTPWYKMMRWWLWYRNGVISWELYTRVLNYTVLFPVPWWVTDLWGRHGAFFDVETGKWMNNQICKEEKRQVGKKKKNKQAKNKQTCLHVNQQTSELGNKEFIQGERSLYLTSNTGCCICTRACTCTRGSLKNTQFNIISIISVPLHPIGKPCTGCLELQ